MAISYVDAGAISAPTVSATSLPIAYPTGLNTVDLFVLIVGTKPYTATISTPSGWTARGTVTNGTTAQGADTGSVKIAMFTKLSAGTETGNLTVTVGTTPSSSWGQMLAFRKAVGTTWDIANATGTDTVANTAFSVTFGTNPGITSGDYLVFGAVSPTDATQNWTSPACTATSATIATPTLVDQPFITTGNDSGGRTAYTSCTAGTATAAPVWTATLSTGTNALFSAGVVRLRDVTPAVAADKSSVLTDDFTTEDSAKWLNYELADVAVVSGQLQITPTTGYPGVASVDRYDLTESSALVETVAIPNVGNGSAQANIKCRGNATNYVIIFTEGANLYFREYAAGSFAGTSATYDAVAHRWWRIREISGSFYWDTSPDGVAWTNQLTKVRGFAPTDVDIVLESGFWGTEPTPGTVIFDNLNVPPATTRVRPISTVNPATSHSYTW